MWLVKEARQKIREDNFVSWKNSMIAQLKQKV
jgi:hypothetical protein